MSDEHGGNVPRLAQCQRQDHGIGSRRQGLEERVRVVQLEQLDAGLTGEQVLREPLGGERCHGPVLLVGDEGDQRYPAVRAQIEPGRDLGIFRGAGRQGQRAADCEELPRSKGAAGAFHGHRGRPPTGVPPNEHEARRLAPLAKLHVPGHL